MRTLKFTPAGVLLLAVLPIVLLSPTALAQGRRPLQPSTAAPGGPVAVPYHSNAFGQSLAEWAADAARWEFMVPTPQNPMLAQDGADLCAWPNTEKLWYIAGQFCLDEFCDLPRTYTCRVPAGKPILYNPVGYTAIDYPPGSRTIEEMRAEAAAGTDAARDVTISVDGVPVANLSAHRVSTPPYVVGPLPEDNIFAFFGFDAPAGSSFLLLDDIYAVRIPPLPPGPHRLHATGRFEGGFNFEATVLLDVVAGGRGGHMDAAPLPAAGPAATTDPAAPRTTWGSLKILYR